MVLKNLVILIDKDKKKFIEKIAEDLTKEGLKVENKLSITGVISGTAQEETLERLKSVDGVSELREEGIFTLPPLDRDTPQ